jgi:hypothetical protein
MATDNEVGLIGFFSVFSTQDKQGFLGALLVTDRQGKPEEFRVTLPIKPTPVQKMLYGKSLNRHVGVQLCGSPLFGALKKHSGLSILIVSDPDWLPLAEVIECKVVQLAPAGAKLQIEGQPNQASITPTSASFPSLAAQYPPTYSAEQRQKCTAVLQEYSLYIDLCEPFQRMEMALGVLATEDQKFR